jgi:hypothetical protein
MNETDQPSAADRGSELSAGLGLVKRLRFLASGQDDPHSVALTEAADEIERLRVTLHHVECGLRAAEEERDELRAANDRFGQRQAWWTDRMFELETERDALRAALELIAAPMRTDGTWNRDREACRELAAQALGRCCDSKSPNVCLD